MENCCTFSPLSLEIIVLEANYQFIKLGSMTRNLDLKNGQSGRTDWFQLSFEV